jgi:arylsulfatase A-like enzyme
MTRARIAAPAPPAPLRAVLAAFGAVAGLSAGCGETSGPAQPPNVLLVSIDTLRADHLSSYGYERNTTPHLDALAARGLLFEAAHSTSSWTLPAHASLLTGRYPSFHGLEDEGAVLPEGLPTLAERFRELGYATFAVVAHVYVGREFGLDRGFDSFDDSLLEGGTRNPRAAEVVDRVLAHVDADGDRPFFAFVHLFDPHWDYAPPPPWDARFTDPGYAGPVDGTLRSLSPWSGPDRAMPAADLAHLLALYDGEVAYADAEIGRLLAALEERGALERTVVAVTADHGEEFEEHGRLGHGHSLYGEVLRVPLILAGHPRLPAGERRREPVSLVDVAATLLDLAGGAAPAGAQGKSLLAAAEPERAVFAESVRFGLDLRAARRDAGSAVDDRSAGWRRFFDLARDPGEQAPLDADPSGGALGAALDEYAGLADRGWSLRLVSLGSAPLELRARITTPGRIVAARPQFSNLGRWPVSSVARFDSFDVDAEARELRFEVEVSRIVGAVRFETEPPDAPVQFEFTLGGDPDAAGVFLGGGERLAAGQPFTLEPRDPRVAPVPGRRVDLATGVHIAAAPARAARGAELDPATREHLRALGYADEEPGSVR